MISVDYEAYLKSRHWRERCTAKMLLDGNVQDELAYRSLCVEVMPACDVPRTWSIDYEQWLRLGRPFTVQCEDCGLRVPRWLANCHHLDYLHIFKERREDLVVVCEACHCKRHKQPEPEWWPTAKAVDWSTMDWHARPIGAVMIDVMKSIQRKPSWLSALPE